jgi:predicted homoserine dehydrogenase-like protein
MPMTNVALTGLARELARRAEEGRPVRIGAHRLRRDGHRPRHADASLHEGRRCCRRWPTRRPHTAKHAIELAYGETSKFAEAEGQSRVTAAIEQGRIAVTSVETMVTNPLIDVVVDATGKPGVAADFNLIAMEHSKHLVMMNVEADVTIGVYLKKQAERLGVVYTVGAGDEPSSCMELIEFAYRRSAIRSCRPARARTTRSTTTRCPTTTARKRNGGT